MLEDELKNRLTTLTNKPENQRCVDCLTPVPTWASIIVPPPGSALGSKPIGAFCCYYCSGSHRCLGVHVSFVRSITLDTWKEQEVLAMENGGNDKVNAIFEANYSEDKPEIPERPQKECDLSTRESFIRAKYENRMFYNPSLYTAYSEGRVIPIHKKVPRRSKVQPSDCPSRSVSFAEDTRILDDTSHTKNKKKGITWKKPVLGVLRGSSMSDIFQKFAIPTDRRSFNKLE